DVGGCLDRLDDSRSLTHCDSTACFGHLYKDEIAQGMLRVIGDSDLDRAIRQSSHPLVRLGVLEIRRNIAHRFTPFSNHRLAESHERRLDHPCVEKLAADIDLHLLQGSNGNPCKSNGSLESWGKGPTGGLP